MTVTPLEVYDTTSNAAVVRMPTRRFPGVVVQGDTVSILHGMAEEIRRKVKDSPDDDLVAGAEELENLLVRVREAVSGEPP